MTTDAKRCSRCGWLQCIEAFPLHVDSSTKSRPKRRSSWCRECWREHHAASKARKRAVA